MDWKKCSICQEFKSLNEFRKLKHGRSSHCKPCAAAYLRAWRSKNAGRLREQRAARTERERESHREQRRRYGKAAYAKNPEKHRDARLRYQFGITLTEYRVKESRQQGKCAICREKCPTGRALAVDHDHGTGQVRGLLCANCNRGVGLFQDNPTRLITAAQYLLAHTDVLKEAI
jgi:hypothetical protein